MWLLHCISSPYLMPIASNEVFENVLRQLSHIARWCVAPPAHDVSNVIAITQVTYNAIDCVFVRCISKFICGSSLFIFFQLCLPDCQLGDSACKRFVALRINPMARLYLWETLVIVQPRWPDPECHIKSLVAGRVRCNFQHKTTVGHCQLIYYYRPCILAITNIFVSPILEHCCYAVSSPSISACEDVVSVASVC